MTGFFDRSVRIGLSLAVAGFALFWLLNRGWDVALRDAQFFNGWVLTGAIFGLMLLTLRKRVVILPLGRVRGWMALHYYLGFACVGVFFIHAGTSLPDSPIEWVLWTLFVFIAVSGLFGALLAKLVPLRLEEHGERIIFERIPVFRRKLAEEAEVIALDSVRDGNTVSIAELHAERLAAYFARPRHIAAHLMSSNLPVSRIMGELASIERYLDEAGKERLARLRELVLAKDNLDFQYANGGLLKLWLFVHVPASWAMLLVMLAHIVIAYAYSAGVA